MRSHMALNRHSFVIDELNKRESIGEQLPLALDAVRLLATYLNDPSSREMVLLTLNEWVGSSEAANNHLLLIAGIIYGAENKFSDAFSALQRPTASLEHGALCVLLYLQMDRLDMAEKQLEKMQAIEEDSTLTQLASAWVFIAKGGEKCDEASLLFQELGDRFGTSTTLLNGSAVAFMMLQNYPEAERLLLESAEKDGENADTLINLIVASRHLGKTVDQYLSQLKRIAPAHPWLESMGRLEAGFDRIAANFA